VGVLRGLSHSEVSVCSGGANGYVNPADKTPSQNPRLLFEVSAVGFNKDHNLALVYIAHHCGGLCGGGTYHLMAKKDGKWMPDRDFQGGPACLWVA
jgi:hypothetical protein